MRAIVVAERVTQLGPEARGAIVIRIKALAGASAPR
jgi:hypothetical protein